MGRVEMTSSWIEIREGRGTTVTAVVGIDQVHYIYKLTIRLSYTRRFHTRRGCVFGNILLERTGVDPRLIRHPATIMAIGHRKPRTYHRSAGASCGGQSKTYTCAALDVNGELLYLRPFRARVRAHVRREGIPP